MNEVDGDEKDLIQVIDGQPMLEPELPPFTLCGGLQVPYYPSLTDKQLHAIMLHPDVLPSASQAAWCELGSRRKGSKRGS